MLNSVFILSLSFKIPFVLCITPVRNVELLCSSGFPFKICFLELQAVFLPVEGLLNPVNRFEVNSFEFLAYFELALD